MSNRDELERLQRLRERQLRSRDPYKKQRQVDQKVSKKFKKENISLIEALQEIPLKWWGMIIGAIFGFILALILDKVLHVRLLKIEAFWVEYLWYTLIFFGIAVGRAVGAAMSWQEGDHDALVTQGRK